MARSAIAGGTYNVISRAFNDATEREFSGVGAYARDALVGAALGAASGGVASGIGRALRREPVNPNPNRTIDPPPEGAKSAYEVAAAGGKNAGLLKNYAGRSAAGIRKGITSLERRAAEHGEKIANPAQFAERWGRWGPESGPGS